MFPVMLDIKRLKMVVVGTGKAAEQRKRLLREAGASNVAECATVEDVRVESVDVAFIADMPDAEAETLYERFKAAGALVNVEDRMAWCDFHVPAMVRRGDLLLTVSTGGASPGLARRIKKALANLFPESWAERVQEIAKKREKWRAQGVPIEELGRMTNAMLDKQGWLTALEGDQK